ncbi:uncharacterized protein LOC143248347 [Tachypleus tridentatus]|uniref:uncharacterized protein LOC143248347 n=1 Tax=Tachypleus tridentatus TaxID=6853 RepID=UPI003FD22FBB
MLKVLVLCMLATAAYAGNLLYSAPAVKVIQAPVVAAEKPEPFDFSYNSKDDDGNTQSRQESGDGSGAVTGSYSYADANGLYRRVSLQLMLMDSSHPLKLMNRVLRMPTLLMSRCQFRKPLQLR